MKPAVSSNEGMEELHVSLPGTEVDLVASANEFIPALYIVVPSMMAIAVVFIVMRLIKSLSEQRQILKTLDQEVNCKKSSDDPTLRSMVEEIREKTRVIEKRLTKLEQKKA